MTKDRRSVTILLLGLLTAVVPFSIDMYLPGFPDIARSMDTTVSRVALSLSSFFVGIGIGQLLYGPLMDRYGRKRPLYAGMLLYCVSSIGCVFAPTIEILIILRFIEAIGACAATIASTAMVRDFFPPEENARIFSFLILILSISPLLAPTAGSFISTTWGWQAIFIGLTSLIIIISLGVFFFLPESKPPDKSYSLRPSAILKSFASVLGEPYFIIFSFTGGIAFASLFSFIASSPGVFIGHYGLTQNQYGLLFAFLVSGLITSTQLNRILLKRLTSERIITAGLIFQNAMGVIFVVVSFLQFNDFWLTISLLFFYLFSIGFTMPNATALSMKPFEKNAGSASALLGFIQMGLGSVSTIVVGVLDIKTVLPMALSMLVCSLLGLSLYVISIAVLRKKTGKKNGLVTTIAPENPGNLSPSNK